MGRPGGLWRASICLVSFSFFASFVYILNDLLDREADRNHSRKRLRPIASGVLTPIQAGSLATAFFVVEP